MRGVVWRNDESEMPDSIKVLHGQLTGTTFAGFDDLSKYVSCIDALRKKRNAFDVPAAVEAFE